MTPALSPARMALIIILASICGAPKNAFADVTLGDACPGGAQSAQSTDGNNVVCAGGAWQYPYYTARTVAASAGSSCSGTTAGSLRYNSTLTSIEFCDGTTWIVLYKVTSNPSITTPANSGYFVMSVGTWDGNLGGHAGADTKCLTDITTNTGWIGYSTANSNGQLVAGRVRAFLCANNTCFSPIPLGTYYFADASNGASGGASLTVDSTGIGPNDSNSWTGAAYFGATYSYWTGRAATGTTTAWSMGAAGGTCSNFITNASGSSSNSGTSNSTTGGRWSSVATNCNNLLHLICVVDP